MMARSQRVQAGLRELKSDSGHAMKAKRPGAVGDLTFKAGVVARLIRRVGWQTAQQGDLGPQGCGQLGLDAPFQFGWRAYDGVNHRITWPARWRRVHPEAIDLEIAFGDLIDRLEPDVVHAHDMHVIGVAARAAGRAKLRGKDLKVVYDAHEYVPGIARYGARTRKYIAAWANHEREYIGCRRPGDHGQLGDRRTGCRASTSSPRKPDGHPEHAGHPRVGRDRAGHPGQGPAARRGAAAGLQRRRSPRSGGSRPRSQALPELPGVHLAVVCVPAVETQPVVDTLRRRSPRRSRSRTGCTT